MKTFVQHSKRPSQVLFSFDEVVSPNVSLIRWAVAYSTVKGCNRLINRVVDRMGQAQWDATKKLFVTSIDFGLTEPNALEFLAGQPNSVVHVANPEVHLRAGFRPKVAYHPKVFLFDQLGSTGYVVGSANLTASALLSNTEVVVAGDEVPTNGRWNDAWADLIVCAPPMTQSLLDAYRKKWIKPKPRPVEPDPSPPAPVIAVKSKAILGDAISTGVLNSGAFEHFWIEAGSMSSGGSHNQLELPRGANRFFGFFHNTYDAKHVTIGVPVLTSRGSVWTNRPLTWHGKNAMERINLPTIGQGGFDYRNKAILFRRHASGFEINVFPWDDDAAIAWRAASESLGTVFRLGVAGSRICGLF